MSKFGNRSSGSKFGGNSQSSNNTNNNNGGGRPTYQGRSNNGGGGGGKGNFVNVGSITVTKKTLENLGPEIQDELKHSGISLVASIFLPKGQNQLVLQNSDKLLIQLKEVTGKDGKVLTDKKGNPMDFLVGKLVLTLE